MKSNIFLAVVFLLIAGGIYMFIYDTKSEFQEITETLNKRQKEYIIDSELKFIDLDGTVKIYGKEKNTLLMTEGEKEIVYEGSAKNYKYKVKKARQTIIIVDNIALEVQADFEISTKGETKVWNGEKPNYIKYKIAPENDMFKINNKRYYVKELQEVQSRLKD